MATISVLHFSLLRRACDVRSARCFWCASAVHQIAASFKIGTGKLKGVPKPGDRAISGDCTTLDLRLLITAIMNDQQSRRHFLKAASVLTFCAAAGVGASVPAVAQEPIQRVGGP